MKNKAQTRTIENTHDTLYVHLSKCTIYIRDAFCNRKE